MSNTSFWRFIMQMQLASGAQISPCLSKGFDFASCSGQRQLGSIAGEIFLLPFPPTSLFKISDELKITHPPSWVTRRS